MNGALGYPFTLHKTRSYYIMTLEGGGNEKVKKLLKRLQAAGYAKDWLFDRRFF